MMGKVDVNGDKAHPLWEHIKTEKPGLMGMKRIKWNYGMFPLSASERGGGGG
jgi:glutathione peroxidase-family protein